MQGLRQSCFHEDTSQRGDKSTGGGSEVSEGDQRVDKESRQELWGWEGGGLPEKRPKNGHFSLHFSRQTRSR